MSKPIQTYSGPGIRVTFDPNLCTHAARCVKGLPSVFNVNNKPWIQPSEATADEVEAQVRQCPSGALNCERG